MRNARAIRELLGLFMLVVGGIGLVICTVWLFLADLAPVGYLVLAAFTFVIGVRLTWREVELPEIPERRRAEAERDAE